MNKHVELVKKWLADPKSVTQKELEDNYKAALAAFRAAYADDEAVDAAAWAAAYEAAESTYCAAARAAAWAAAAAAYWVKRYEELTNE